MFSEPRADQPPPPRPEDRRPRPKASAAIKRVHAIDPPEWWCAGVFSPVPVRFVGLGHAASPRRQGWPVHHCETCGEDLFIEYEVDPKIPSWEEVAARVPA